MTSYSIREKAIGIGIVLGIVFALVQVSSSQSISEELLAGAYAVILVLVTIVFLPSAKWGLVAGLVAVVCEPVAEFAYCSFLYGTGIAGGLLLYSVLFLPRLVILPLSGLLGGAVAAEFKPKSEIAQKKGGRKESRKTARDRGN